jgi:hypothetical protein
MTRDWKAVARALALEIPEADLDRITPALEALEAAFRPLAAEIPHETEPAVLFFCPVEESL